MSVTVTLVTPKTGKPTVSTIHLVDHVPAAVGDTVTISGDASSYRVTSREWSIDHLAEATTSTVHVTITLEELASTEGAA